MTFGHDSEILARLVTRDVAAALIHVHVATIDRARKSGDLTDYSTGGRVWVDPEELVELLKKRGAARNGRDSG